MDDSIRALIKTEKQKLRGAGHNLKAAFNRAENYIKREADVIQDMVSSGRTSLPEISYKSVAAGTVTDAQKADINHRGFVVVRGVYSTAQAEDWNAALGEYIAENDYLAKAEKKRGLDNYFSQLADARPQIFGIYWSKPQVQARQGETMAVTKRFINNLWDVNGPNGREFDPDNDYAYADRTRRRQPGDKTLGLSPHMDSGSYERWTDAAFQKVYGAVFAGDWESYDPWKAAYRTQTVEYKSPAVCSAFRTFQGWTALTSQGPNDGTLRVAPVAKGIAYMLLRALQDDVPEDELCGAEPGRALSVKPEWHPELLKCQISIPLMQPGDTLWWHPDTLHAVEAEHQGKGYSNVIYIAGTPRCEKNRIYTEKQAQAFLAGKSAPDFAAEDYEVDFKGRATLADLTELGRAQMGL